jgi:hypothetical protein
MAYILSTLMFIAVVSVVAGAIAWAAVRLSGRGGKRLMLQRADDQSYVRVNLDDVESVDILDRHEAVIHLAEDRKIIVTANDAKRVVRKLR